MKTIQETPEFIIYRDFCPFTWHEERFLKNKLTGEESMFAEDVARIMGFRDIHEMITDPEVLNLIDFSTMEPGIYPIITMTVAEAKRLFQGIDETPLEKAEYFEENCGQPLQVAFAEPDQMGEESPEQELAFALSLLTGSNPSIAKAALVPVLSTTSQSKVIENEFAIELHGTEGMPVVLTKEDLWEIHGILRSFAPSKIS